jgi:hypothetical protein
MIFDAAKVAGQQWVELTDAEYRPPPPPPTCAFGEEAPPGVLDFHIGQYPFMYQLSDGTVFHAGAAYGLGPCYPTYRRTRSLNVAAQAQADSWRDAEAPDPGIAGDAATMYDTDRVLKAGGKPGDITNQVTNQAWRMYRDTSASPPALRWVEAASMNRVRRYPYLITLPDGKVLAVGGQSSWRNGPTCNDHAVLEAEVWDPTSNTWTLLAPMSAGRWKHSLAFLLPDARVLVAAGDKPPQACQTRDGAVE